LVKNVLLVLLEKFCNRFLPTVLKTKCMNCFLRTLIKTGKIILVFISVFASQNLIAQVQDSTQNYHQTLDSLFIAEVEDMPKMKAKVLHAEPLYIDLIRDLGARKGEKEWNVGMGLTDNTKYDEYEALIEYEWAPIDRLGLEIEIPATFYYASEENGEAPGSRINSLKLASQWSFFVSEKMKTTMAIGYLHEFEFTEFNKLDIKPFYKGNMYNPFFIVAKRFGNNYHTLLYTGPRIFQHFEDRSWETAFEVNLSFHYMISGTRNFLGVELNKEFDDSGFSMVVRPQIRVSLADNLLIGLVTGIPINRSNERLSTFVRIIYEPGHSH